MPNSLGTGIPHSTYPTTCRYRYSMPTYSAELSRVERVTKPRRARDPAATSKLMRSVRRRDTDAELVLHHALKKCNLRFATHDSRLPGTPDVIFRRARTVVFVDGDYWHGRIFLEGGLTALRRTLRTRNRQFWVTKITRNVERDRQQTRELKKLGWRVIRFWERDILRDPRKVGLRIRSLIRK
jgi:DNA mismatch endonuclease, patch repair protein